LLEFNQSDFEFAISEIFNWRGLYRVWPVLSEGEGPGEEKGHNQEGFEHEESVARFRDGVKGDEAVST